MRITAQPIAMHVESTLPFEQLDRFLRSIPFNALVGLKLARLHRDGITVECRLREELMNGAGVLHGGVTATLADVAAGMALARHIGRTRAATTVELKINYLRPVASGKVRARAYLLKTGATLSSIRVDVTDGQRRLVASALITYMLLAPR